MKKGFHTRSLAIAYVVDYKRDNNIFWLVFWQYPAKKEVHRDKTSEKPARICHLGALTSIPVTVGVIACDDVPGHTAHKAVEMTCGKQCGGLRGFLGIPNVLGIRKVGSGQSVGRSWGQVVTRVERVEVQLVRLRSWSNLWQDPI